MTIKRKAAASPTKAFFVRMITRDITLEDCILDLIDNSVDGAWENEGSPPMSIGEGSQLSAYEVCIEASPDRFAIRDNCGGMTLENAADHAFSFGRKVREHHDDYSIGVYGIGMKRAVFKLGNDIRIRSTYRDPNENGHSFAVPIIVSEWLDNDIPPWDFDIEEAEPLDENGVEIVVTSLTAGACESFGNPAFVQNLHRIIARDYSLHLNRGLKIFLNGEAISGWKIELRQSEDFEPMRFVYEEEVDGSRVSVEIIGGMAAAPPEDNEPSGDRNKDRASGWGWYVACNGRIVLAADKTSVSGWGEDDWQQWHPQYSGFVGLVLFTSANAEALPLTTTKRSVDTTSAVYRRARRPHMRDLTRKWIDYTNRRKQALEEAKLKEANAKAVPINQIQAKQSAKLPDLSVKLKEKPANVNYSVPIPKMKRLAEKLGDINMSYKDVGLRSFEYTYSDYVGED